MYHNGNPPEGLAAPFRGREMTSLKLDSSRPQFCDGQKINIEYSQGVVNAIEDAPIPEPGELLQVRTGKVKKNGLGGSITSAIYKQEQNGQVFCSPTGLVGDEHAYPAHGGTERAVLQYDPEHYEDWRAEDPPKADLYDLGAYGENIATTNMTEENVCIGDKYQLGKDVLLEVSEPRHPCFKLNSRFQWPRALKRTIRTGRAGWNMRVLKTGEICKGDMMTLVERPYPKWSILNVLRVIKGKDVPLDLLAESIQLPMTDLWKGIAKERLRTSPKTYTLVGAKMVTERVRKLTFALKGSLPLDGPEFDRYAFAQIKFGQNLEISRSYSIVDGDLYKFSLGISLADQSRGGSEYLHKNLRIGDEIKMSPGANAKAVENDQKCDENSKRILIVGGIGITAFLPSIREWESKGLPYHLHYAVRNSDDAAFFSELHKANTTLYAKSRGERLDINSIVPQPDSNKEYHSRIFSCGPPGMMKACQKRTYELGYPEHMVHFEDFGSGAGGDFGEPFEVEVDEPETKRHETLKVPSNKTLLDVLSEAGFDVLFSCKAGGCGACKVTVSGGDIDYNSNCLTDKEKGSALQACVDRGRGKLTLEID